jgi:GNAT superfamily N-acetyltransferase
VSIREISPADTIPLRHAVLWPHLPISHVYLPDDDNGHHYGAFLPGGPNPVGVISIFTTPIPDETAVDPQRHAIRFRKFACRTDLHGQGIGSLLLKHVICVAEKELGADIVWCDARLATEEWYLKRGLSRFGGTFFKDGIEYVRMKTQKNREGSKQDVDVQGLGYEMIPRIPIHT